MRARRGAAKEVLSSSGPSETTETDAGPLESSDQEATGRPGPRRRPRRPPAPLHHGGGSGDESTVVRKPSRAKSQPSLVAKETLQRSGRHHWLDAKQQVRTQSHIHTITHRHTHNQPHTVTHSYIHKDSNKKHIQTHTNTHSHIHARNN